MRTEDFSDWQFIDLFLKPDEVPEAMRQSLVASLLLAGCRSGYSRLEVESITFKRNQHSRLSMASLDARYLDDAFVVTDDLMTIKASLGSIDLYETPV